MPEFPELLAFVHLIQQGRGFPGSLKQYKSLKFIVQIIPLCLSLGSQKRSFECLHANKGDYLPKSTPSQNHQLDWLPSEWPPISWLQRTQEPWRYLLDPPQEAGELICASRGKLLALAAGNHAVCISLGLEAHVFGMTRKDFLEIIAKDIPGPNEDTAKAEKIRTFLIPERLIVPDSSSRRPRTIKLFAAFISSDWVHVLSDFSGLVRMFVKSKQSHWTQDDLSPASEHWDAVFDSFKGGPDWISEKRLAMTAITKWRFAVLEEHSRWQHKVDEKQKAYNKALKAYKSTRRLESYFQPKHGRSFKTPTPPSLPVFPPQPFRPIIKEIGANSLGAFSGFGRHTSNDFLFLQAIFPGMPSYLICEDNDVFEAFASAIEAYILSFTTEEFYRRIVTVTNSDNPFAFNEESNKCYMKSYLLVFRRVKVDVDRDLYMHYCRLGYLDPHHTMGEEYPSERAEAQAKDVKKWKSLPVYLHDGFNAYSIIKAQCPSNWAGPLASVENMEVKKDISKFGYNTTIGLAQFHEQLLNRVSHSVNIVKPGRPRKEYTGKKGRPRKVKSTKKAQLAAIADKFGRKAQILGTANKLQRKAIVPATNATDVTTYPDEDMEALTDTEITWHPDPDLVEDPNDNSGDADAAGDGSACIEDKFIEYDNPEEHGANLGATPEKGTQTQLVVSVKSKSASKSTVFGMPTEDLEAILRDAHLVCRQFGYTNSNPYVFHNTPLIAPPGIMTYWRANAILRKWHILGSKFMAPFFARRRLHGSTLPKIGDKGYQEEITKHWRRRKVI